MTDTSDVGIQNADIFREVQTEGEKYHYEHSKLESKMN